MERKVMVLFKEKNNLLDAISYLLEQEQIDFVLTDKIIKPKDITDVIIIDSDSSLESNFNVPIIAFYKDKSNIKNTSSNITYLVTPLIDDNNKYTPVQKEYLFKRGIFSVILKQVLDLINNKEIDRLVIDFSYCKETLKEWVFDFSSISETYQWLSNKNKTLDKNFVQKVVNFYHDKIYNDSLKEINYLTEKIVDIKEGKTLIDLFICTKEELNILKNNYFFKVLLKNISKNYQLFIIDKNELIKNDFEIYNKLLDGVAIYDDSVYIDTYDNEYSLGFVDCKEATIKEYNNYFDAVLKKYGKKVNGLGDIDGI